MQLALSTWHEVEDYLRTQEGIIVPVGSVEQHGPNGLIGTDHLCAEVVAKGVGDKIGCMVAPTLAYGMSQHHLGFAGSVTLRPSTLMLVVRDVVQSLGGAWVPAFLLHQRPWRQRGDGYRRLR